MLRKGELRRINEKTIDIIHPTYSPILSSKCTSKSMYHRSLKLMMTKIVKYIVTSIKDLIKNEKTNHFSITEANFPLIPSLSLQILWTTKPKITKAIESNKMARLSPRLEMTEVASMPKASN